MKTIAEQLRKKNIAEYLIYMWQVEDMIRASHCNMEDIRSTILSQLADEARSEEEQWYADLCAMMKREGVEEHGHLQINQNIITALTDVHNALLASPKFPFYNTAYFKALPFIVELRQKRRGTAEEPEIETCFEALYGVLLLRLQKKMVGEETQKAMTAISDLLSLLAGYYEKDRKGELELE